MTVAELIEQLQQQKPYLVVRLWDTRREHFTERFHLQSATFDSELLLTPAEGPAPQPPPAHWPSLFDEPPAAGARPGN